MRFLVMGFVTLACLAGSPAAAGEPGRGASIDDLAALTEIGGAYFELAVSPDGATAAVIDRRPDFAANDYAHAVIAIDIASGRAREIGDAGRFVLRSDHGRHSGVGILRQPQFSADGRSVYYLREHLDAIEIWRAAIDGSGASSLVRASGDVRRFRVDGETILFETSTPRDALAAERARGARLGFAIDDRFAPSYALAPMPDIDREVRVWTLDAEGRRLEATVAEAAQLEADPRPHVRPLDPELEADEPPTGVFDEASGAQCADQRCSGAITHTWRLEAEGEQAILFRRLEGHARRITAFYIWTPSTRRVRRVWSGQERTDGCALAASALVCLQEAFTQPRRVVLIDRSNGRIRSLYDPNPRWREIAAPRIERFDFADREGNQSFAHLVYPLNWRPGRAYPLIIAQYRSRGFLFGGTGEETPILPLSARGYFVLNFDRPEFRERGARMSMAALQREVELAGIERSAKREALMYFIERAIDRGADRDRIGITGLSDGAETVYWMLIDEPVFAAAVVSTPPIDPTSWMLQSPSARAYLHDRSGLTGPWDDAPEPWRSWWRRSAPVFHADRLRTPILFNLAEAEALRAFPLMTRLREGARAYDAYLYPGAYHLKWRPLQIRAAQQRTLDWFDFWLRGIEREDPDEPGRLERWRALRHAQDDEGSP